METKIFTEELCRSFFGSETRKVSFGGRGFFKMDTGFRSCQRPVGDDISGGGSRQKEEDLAAMRRQMERMASKITQLESGKKWKHKGNEKRLVHHRSKRNHGGQFTSGAGRLVREEWWFDPFIN